MDGHITQNRNNGIGLLKKELDMLRSLVISTVGRDREGKYNPQFVKKILRVLKEKPAYKFKDSTSFLKHLAE